MERRTTRSSARQAALLAAGATATVNSLQLADSRRNANVQKTAKGGRKSTTDAIVNQEITSTDGIVVNGAPPAKRRKRNTTGSSVLPVPGANDELPHNLGKLAAIEELLSPRAVKDLKTARSPSVETKLVDDLAAELQETVNKATATVAEPKAKKKANSYGLTPGVSPFPDWSHPTPEECEEVNRLLSSIHGEVKPPTTIPEPSLTVTGCGEVPSVLDALIRTLLSGATTGKNSAMAFNGLVKRFGVLKEGIGKGSVDWDAVRRAPVKDVYEAMKSGGLADVKSKKLKAILDMVYEENQARMKAALSSTVTPSHVRSGIKDATQAQAQAQAQYEIACADQNVLSLNHYHQFSQQEAMAEMLKFPGIGPKTAACVVLFCLQRPCFAVDTHIFRICKWLRWVPPNKATEITTFSHLEVRIPDHLKYSLHQLFIRHGKSCPRCRAITSQSSVGWEEGCVIDHLVKRTGKRKGVH